MNILILFATYSGGTEMAASLVADVMKSKGHTVDVKNPSQVEPQNLNSYDVTVLATPTWDANGQEGQPHEDFFPFMEKMKTADITGKKFAVLGLGDSSYAHYCGSVDVLEQFLQNAKAIIAVPSIKIDGFFFNQEKHTQDIKAWAQKIG